MTQDRYTRQDRRLTRRRVAACGIMATALLRPGRAAFGQPVQRPIQVVETQPPANGLVDRHPAQYFIRFSAPVDHYRSRLIIAQGDTVVHVLQPRLDAAPTLLFGFAPGLQPGAYELRWVVTSLQDGAVTEGAVAFTVRP
jgi:methionine-rich copper-binding protein CopC